ncbi:MFS transporter [Luteipulveratus sp. YIM 133132]|uniref:MFS transporter n=1 Tax=Luteipulveratus flavus TaxID=3031728 RepID=UPI0023AFCFDF|nr:MFS transporter [Luteipulveratus sp. YIM 133132]MDE9366905.1 MFS transporter [Luteipulveratus sp. YIM 133132]
MTDATLRHPLGGARAWAVWTSAVLVYLLAVFHRTSLGVAGLIAADRFHISSAQLATFAMVQLAVYAAMQIPVGALLDRYGSKVLLVAGVVTMSAAQLAFAFVDSYAAGIVARVFVGMGDAMVFVSVLRLVALWFPPARTPMVTQVTGFAGQLGALAAAGPLAAALDGLGWTRSFLLAAAIGVVLGVVLLLVVQDSPYADPDRTDIKLRAVGRALRLAWRQPGTRLGLWCHFTSQFSANVFAIMWGFPFLTAGEGLSTGEASRLLALMVVTTVLSSPLFGVFVSRYPYSRSTLILGVVATIMTVWTVVLLWPGRAPMWMLVVLVVATAIGGPGSMIGFDLARTFNPPTRIGSATGIVNVGGFVAALGTVVLIGVVLDRVSPGGPSTYTVDSFRWAMAVQYLVWFTGVAMIVRYRRRTRRHIHADETGAYEHLIPERLRAAA